MIHPLKQYHLVFECNSLKLNGISHKIDKDVHDSSEVSDDSRGGEEQTVGHDLQVELDAHKDHKHVLANLKQTFCFEQQPCIDFCRLSLFVQRSLHVLLVPATWGRA